MSYIDQHIGPLHFAIAEELRDVAGLIAQIADVLVGDEQFAMANIAQLQAFDLVIQRADESAGLLERLANGSSSLEAVDGVRLTAVQDRLRTALSAAA